VARASVLAPPELADELRAALVGHYATTRDSGGTNSHYCLSVLHLTDSLVCSIADRVD
jgi:hypothetical protein